MWTLAVYTIKGGVGKTATAVNIAAEAARAGWRVLLWDLDPQGASGFYLRTEGKAKSTGQKLVEGSKTLMDVALRTDQPRLHVVPSDMSYRNLDLFLDAMSNSKKRLGEMIQPAEDEYNLVVLDCPPGLSLLSENILRGSDGIMVPVIPTTLSLRTLEQLNQFIKEQKLDIELWPFLSMIDSRKRLHRDIEEAFDKIAPKRLKTEIPLSVIVERMGIERAPVRAYAPTSRPAKAFADLWYEVSLRLPPYYRTLAARRSR